MAKNTNKINILILSCGLNAGYHVSRILKEKFENKFKIIGTDINKEFLISNRAHLDVFYQVPYSCEDNYYNAILEICRKEGVNCILPSFEIDQMLFSPENKDLKNLGIISLSTPECTFDFYKNKYLMFKKLEELEFPVPKMYAADELIETGTYFIKPINGSGSKNAIKAETKEIKNITNIENYLIQEVCTQPEITLECFQYKGKLAAAARQRIETKSGVCTKAKVFSFPELESIAKKLLKKINCPYFFNLQFMKNKNDEFVITDVNFRLAAGMGLTYAAGWDEVSAIANLILGNSEEKIFESLKLNSPVQYVVRAYTDIVTRKANKILGFDLDGTILNSFDRHTDVLSDALKKHNITLDLSDFIEYKRGGNSTYGYLISKNICEKSANEINEYWCSHIEDEKYLKTDFVYEDAKRKLAELLKGNELILITARNNRENCLKQLKNLGLTEYFSNIYIVKSDSKTFERKANILKEHGVFSYTGDTESDKKACDIAGVKFVPVFHGFRTEHFFLTSDFKAPANMTPDLI